VEVATPGQRHRGWCDVDEPAEHQIGTGLAASQRRRCHEHALPESDELHRLLKILKGGAEPRPAAVRPRVDRPEISPMSREGRRQGQQRLVDVADRQVARGGEQMTCRQDEHPRLGPDGRDVDVRFLDGQPDQRDVHLTVSERLQVLGQAEALERDVGVGQGSFERVEQCGRQLGQSVSDEADG
jgi:hypothetical protein